MTARPTDDRSQTELAVEMADEWLSSHRKSETWRVVDMVRDELVRTAGRLAEVEALRAERDQYRDVAIEATRQRNEVHGERGAALARIEKVRGVHAPVEVEPSETICRGCSTERPGGRFFPYAEYPCATIRALDGTDTQTTGENDEDARNE